MTSIGKLTPTCISRSPSQYCNDGAAEDSTSINFGFFGETLQENTPIGHNFDYFYDQWHHLAVTNAPAFDSDGSFLNSAMKFYLDGTEFHSNPEYGNQIGFDMAQSTTLGTYNDLNYEYANLHVATDHLNGHIDEFAVWKKALTPTEILAAYNTKLDPSSDADLMMYYDFESSFGSTTVPNLGNGGAAYDMLLGATYQGQVSFDSVLVHLDTPLPFVSTLCLRLTLPQPSHIFTPPRSTPWLSVPLAMMFAV